MSAERPIDIDLARENRRRLRELFKPQTDVQLRYATDEPGRIRGTVFRFEYTMVVTLNDPLYANGEVTFMFGLEHDQSVPKPAYVNMEGYTEVREEDERQLIDKLAEYEQVPFT